jgi:hypothetical protein
VVLSQSDIKPQTPLSDATDNISVLELANLQRNYIGSAIGALEECLRSQVKERHAKLYYMLGKVYRDIGRPLKVNEYWSVIKNSSAQDVLLSKGKVGEVKRYLEEIEEVKTL